MSRFAVFRRPPLRRLFLAGLPADLADWLDYVAVITLLTYVWGDGPLVLAIFAIAFGIPYILIGPFLGALVDRLDLRFALIATNLGRALLTLSLFFAPNSIAVLLIVFLRATVDSAFTPARQKAIQALAKDGEREAVNGMVHSANQLTKILGPAIGGALMVVFAPQNIFLLNASLSLLAVLGFGTLALPKRVPKDKNAARSNIFVEAGAGFRTIGRNPILRLAVLFIALNLFAIFLYDTFIALLIKDMGYSSNIFGYTIAAVGVGGVLGGLLAAGLQFGNRHLKVMALSGLCAGLTTIGLIIIYQNGYVPPVLLLLAYFAFFGVSGAFVQVPYRVVLQQETPPERMGSVVAAGEAISIAAMLFAPFSGAFIASQFGIAMPFLFGGALVALGALLGFLPVKPPAQAGKF